MEKVSTLLEMSQRELSRLEVIQRVSRKTLKQRQAAELLSLSTRQIKRLCKAYQREGACALGSKRRGQPSNNRLPQETTIKAVELLGTLYSDFGPTLAHEKLREAHQLSLSLESVRQLMIREGLWQPRRARKLVIHQLRERRARLGELIQIDGSPHDWFEGRCEKCTLLVMVDDATSGLMQMRFCQAETTFNYFAVVRAYIQEHGKPLAFYSDKFSVFRVNIPNALSGTGLTQFGRAMKELSIELICAHSPQAKGRVERANQTLQDRLVKELRLRSISTVEEANAYLPEFMTDYNSRFSVEPRNGEDAHRPLSASEDMQRILTLCERRVLSKNLTLSYNKRIYQITTKRAAYTMRGAQVEVRETSTGEISIEYKGQRLDYIISREQEQRQARVLHTKSLTAATSQPKRQSGPVPMSHPWRNFSYSEKSIAAMERRGEICILRR
jgi:transposase